MSWVSRDLLVIPGIEKENVFIVSGPWNGPSLNPTEKAILQRKTLESFEGVGNRGVHPWNPRAKKIILEPPTPPQKTINKSMIYGLIL